MVTNSVLLHVLSCCLLLWIAAMMPPVIARRRISVAFWVGLLLGAHHSGMSAKIALQNDVVAYWVTIVLISIVGIIVWCVREILYFERHVGALQCGQCGYQIASRTESCSECGQCCPLIFQNITVSLLLRSKELGLRRCDPMLCGRMIGIFAGMLSVSILFHVLLNKTISPHNAYQYILIWALAWAALLFTSARVAVDLFRDIPWCRA